MLSLLLLLFPPRRAHRHTLLVLIFLDQAATSPSSNPFTPFLDIDKSLFPSLSPRRLEVSMTQSSLQFELNAEGKFVRSNVVLPWSSVEKIDPRIFSKEEKASFSGIRFLLFEGERLLAEYRCGKPIRTKEGRGREWRVGGSPLRRSSISS